MTSSRHTRFLYATLAATWLAASGPVAAQSTTTSPTIDDGSKAANPQELTNDEVALAAVALLERQMAAKATARVPLVIRHEAHCVAVFPRITKAGLIIAGKSGRGIVSCRQADSGMWGSPAFYKITSASIGLQAGVQHSSLLLMVVDQKGVDDLLAESISLGSEVSVAAGPVGAEGGVATGASILSYSRAEGVFAGIDIGGSSMSFDKEANAEVYGSGVDARGLVFSQRAATGELPKFRDTLNKFAPRKATGS